MSIWLAVRVWSTNSVFSVLLGKITAIQNKPNYGKLAVCWMVSASRLCHTCRVLKHCRLVWGTGGSDSGIVWQNYLSSCEHSVKTVQKVSHKFSTVFECNECLIFKIQFQLLQTALPGFLARMLLLSKLNRILVGSCIYSCNHLLLVNDWNCLIVQVHPQILTHWLHYAKFQFCV